MAKYITVNVVKINQTAIVKSQNVPVDGIVLGQLASDGSGNTELFVQYTNQADNYQIVVTDTLQEIIDKAVAAGYTENGLAILPITKINQTVVEKDLLLNMQSFSLQTMNPVTDANGTVVGTEFLYTREMEKAPIVYQTSEILIQISGSGDGSGLGEEIL